MKTREEIVNEMEKEYDWFVHDKWKNHQLPTLK